MTLTVISWNILADCYVRGMNKQQQAAASSSLSSSQTESTSTSENDSSTTVCSSSSSISTTFIPTHLLWSERSKLIRQTFEDLFQSTHLKSSPPADDLSAASSPTGNESISRDRKAVDVICLQEVDHYHDFYESLFHEFGYDSLYQPRPNGKRDGCVIAYRRDRFRLKAVERLDLDYLAHLDLACSSSSNSVGNTGSHSAIDGTLGLDHTTTTTTTAVNAHQSKFARQNVALFTLLEEIHHTKEKATNNGQEGAEMEGQEWIVATCHLYWNPNLPEVKYAQAGFVLQQLTKFQELHTKSADDVSKRAAPSVILTGDFNSFPHDEVYELITVPQAREKQKHMQDLQRTLYGSKHLLYGPNTKFLCEFSLARLCRWMRMLGINVAMDSWETPPPTASQTNGEDIMGADISDTATTPAVNSTNTPSTSTKAELEVLKKRRLQAFFDRARQEKRVILTASRLLRERTNCPQSVFVNPSKVIDGLVDIFREFGLELNRAKFLTVCGKCGGDIEEADLSENKRLMGKIFPSDRPIFCCVDCAQVSVY
jgi:uncharacterized protein with PIN domain/endonuclease/exonuclease/phosphatase family metal-dependent hydrolase